MQIVRLDHVRNPSRLTRESLQQTLRARSGLRAKRVRQLPALAHIPRKSLRLEMVPAETLLRQLPGTAASESPAVAANAPGRPVPVLSLELEASTSRTQIVVYLGVRRAALLRKLPSRLEQYQKQADRRIKRFALASPPNPGGGVAPQKTAGAAAGSPSRPMAEASSRPLRPPPTAIPAPSLKQRPPSEAVGTAPVAVVSPGETGAAAVVATTVTSTASSSPRKPSTPRQPSTKATMDAADRLPSLEPLEQEDYLYRVRLTVYVSLLVSRWFEIASSLSSCLQYGDHLCVFLEQHRNLDP